MVARTGSVLQLLDYTSLITSRQELSLHRGAASMIDTPLSFLVETELSIISPEFQMAPIRGKWIE